MAEDDHGQGIAHQDGIDPASSASCAVKSDATTTNGCQSALLLEGRTVTLGRIAAVGSPGSAAFHGFPPEGGRILGRPSSCGVGMGSSEFVPVPLGIQAKSRHGSFFLQGSPRATRGQWPGSASTDAASGPKGSSWSSVSFQTRAGMQENGRRSFRSVAGFCLFCGQRAGQMRIFSGGAPDGGQWPKVGHLTPPSIATFFLPPFIHARIRRGGRCVRRRRAW